METDEAVQAIPAAVETRVQRLHTLPDIAARIVAGVRQDADWMAERWCWGPIIPQLVTALGGSVAQIRPFHQAWSLMYAAIVRLDHLQDGDPLDDPAAPRALGAASMQALLSMVLAGGLLDGLEATVAPERARRLRALWTDMLLRTALGQQADLIAGGDASLDRYQQIAQAKTGSTFALAFGGAAVLLLDADPQIDACTVAGDIFGTLVQIQDDLADATSQPNQTMTFPGAFQALVSSVGAAPAGATPAAFWHVVYPAYRDRAEAALRPCSPAVRAGLLTLFDATFADARPTGEG